MLTMRAASLFSKAGTQARMKIARAVRFMSTVLSQRVSNEASSSKAPPPTLMPALLINICKASPRQSVWSRSGKFITHIKAIECINNLLADLFDPVPVCHIANPSFRTSSMNSIDLIDDSFHSTFVQIQNSNLDSFIGEDFGSLFSHTRGCSGHDSFLALERPRQFCQSSWWGFHIRQVRFENV
jgi:hypothetical protein